ncbi:MAG TPA: DUF1326 domain-containing protein [Humisphaera sp.]|jgi:hypothetical protein|nr:DUF1326 domain-containing protein [Humisphaera sp.]
MKALLITMLALLACSICPASPSNIAAPASKITGDYVEARTASVFAGACHYNGELVTTGRDAIMAWSFTSGSFHGTDLSGVRAMASVTSDDNLSQEHATRKAELIVDTHATQAQVSAVSDLLAEKCGSAIGKIVNVRRAAISFSHVNTAYSVKADGFAAMSVEAMPDDACCAQPNLVWYTPLTPIEHRKVGYTQNASYSAGTLGDKWEREGENSAFYGSFSF